MINIKYLCNKFAKFNKYLFEPPVQKCPNCHQKGFEENIIKKDFVRETTIFITEPSSRYDEYDRYHHFRERKMGREIKTAINNVKYLCKHCNFIIEQERCYGNTKECGDLKTFMSYDEYKEKDE